MLGDGSLSAEDLASKGYVFMDDDESGSDEDEDNADSSDIEVDEESDEVSSTADSDGEDVKESKSRVKTKQKDDTEETGPPRTKHELDVLPPVPKVTAVLEPHHTPVSVGHISSVLDLRVVVESSGTEKVLNENSILWLTEPRVPLGIVDEVFGPVKSPFYIVRFNELSEIPEDAKTGADVSYVSEFSEFVLKDNPSLYKKAVDASGLDDEELESDEDLEFSDDEKEAAARMREKSKRALENRETRQGQDWKSADGQLSKGQRTERGRGCGRSGGRGAATANAVDSAADFVAGMDLRGPPWNSARSGSKHQNGRRWNRGRQSSPRNSGHQEFQTRGSRTGPADGQISLPQHQESSQRRDGHYFAEQANSQMHAHQVRQAGGMQGIPLNAGAVPVHLQGQRRYGLYFSEQGNSQMHSQQLRQVVSMQGIPFNAGALPAHLQGQVVTGQQAHGYHQVPVYDPQFGIPRQGNMYPVQGGPQFIQNSMVFGNRNLPPSPYFNNQGHGQVNMIQNQGYGNIVNAGRLNFGVPVHGSLGDAQAGVHPSLTSLMAPSSLLGSGANAWDPRAGSMPQNNQSHGPSGGPRASNNGQSGHPFGRQRR